MYCKAVSSPVQEWSHIITIHCHYYWPHRMLLLVDIWYLGVTNRKHKIQPTSLKQWYMCQFQGYWVQASLNQDPETLTCKHLQALCLHWHMYK